MDEDLVRSVLLGLLEGVEVLRDDGHHEAVNTLLGVIDNAAWPEETISEEETLERVRNLIK